MKKYIILGLIALCSCNPNKCTDPNSTECRCNTNFERCKSLNPGQEEMCEKEFKLCLHGVEQGTMTELDNN